MAIEDVIGEAAARTVLEVPANSTAFEFRDHFYIQDPDTGRLSRAQPQGVLENIGQIDGRVVGIFDALDDPGAYIAAVADGTFEVYGFDVENGPTDRLLAVPALDEPEDYLGLMIFPDGVGLLERGHYWGSFIPQLSH